MMKTTPLAIMAALIGGWLLGFFMRGTSGRPETHTLSTANRNPAPPHASESPAGAGGRASAPEHGRGEGSRPAMEGRDFATAIRSALTGKSYNQISHDLYEAVQATAVEDIPAALDGVKNFKRAYGDQLRAMLAARWASSDPRAALEYAAARMSPGGGDPIMQAALSRWAGDDPDAAIAWVRGRPAAESAVMMTSVISGLAQDNPARALALARTLPRTALPDTIWHTVFHSWSEREPAAAAAAALTLPPGEQRESALATVAGNWVEQDVAAAIAWAEQMPQGQERNRALGPAVSAWAGSDAAAAAAHVLAMPESEERTHLLNSVLMNMAHQDTEAAVRLLEKMPENARDQGLRHLAHMTAETDLNASGQYVLAMRPGMNRDGALSDLAIRWARKDPAAAAEFLGRLPPGDSREHALLSLAHGWAETDPKAAAEWSLKNTTPKDHYGIRSVIVSNWTTREPDAAVAWVQQLPAGDVRDQLLPSALDGVAAVDLDRAMRMVTALPPGQARTVAAAGTAMTGARKNPSATARWLASLVGSVDDYVYGSFAATWAKEDAKQAATWLERLPTGKPRDAAITDFSRAVLEADPEGALAWAGTIGDAEERRFHLEQLAGDWLRRDSAAASRWISGSTLLGEDARQRLLQRKR